jgi:hypothetical protein
MSLPFSLVQNEDTSVLTTIINGNVYTAEKTHARFQQLVQAVTQADESTDLEELAQMFDPSTVVQNYFDRVSERVSVAGGHVYFDGEEVNDGLANSIIKFINEGNDATPYINFLENIMTNPNEHSRDQLFDWLSRRDFTITKSGNFLAYKGVRPRGTGWNTGQIAEEGDKQYPYESISTGRATVDGKVYNGAIPNGIGAVVEMPRGSVQHDPSVGCHTGLHAGTFEYASDFSRGTVLTVEINPRDVVSVPTDCDWQKIRTCRYTVKEIAKQAYATSFWQDAEDEELDEDYSDDDPFYGDEDESWY